MIDGKPRLLDLFCGAGGAAMGYHRAGFDVVGVDINPQPNYPFEFIQDDALALLSRIEWATEDVDAIHASPPCQPHVKGLAAVNHQLGRRSRYRDLISRTRELLEGIALPCVIENVEGAPLINPVRLCGSSFRLPLRRHRLFECSFPVMVPPCDHSWQHERKYWNATRKPGEPTHTSTVVQVYGNAGGVDQWSGAMGIDWMTRDELREAIPPAYTEHIGFYLMAEVKAKVLVA